MRRPKPALLRRAAALAVLLHAMTAGGAAAQACDACAGLDGFVAPQEIDDDIRRMVGKTRNGGSRNVAVQKARGVVPTGLVPVFAGGRACPKIDSETWALDYSAKRPGAALHKGIDIPQPRETPILAIADGAVVGRFMNDSNRKGIEVMLRHRPDQTGLEIWTYSQYTHLLEMSPLPIGAEVRLGEEIGRTANTGQQGKRVRRDALHFAVLYSRRPEWTNDGEVVMPKDGYFMDPVAFYRRAPPFESAALAALPDDSKAVEVPNMASGGALVPPGSKRIWPYACP